MKTSTITDVWRLLLNFYRPNAISNNRMKHYHSLKEYIKSEPITVIDDPYHAIKGIYLYRFIKYNEPLRVRISENGEELKDLWHMTLGIPKDFADFQSILLSLLIINYKLSIDGLSEEDKKGYISSIDIMEAVKHLAERWERAGAIYVDRILLYAMLKRTMPTINNRKEVYTWLEELHDMLSSLNLVLTPPYSYHRIWYVFSLSTNNEMEFQERKLGKAKYLPGKSFELMPTLSTMFLYSHINELLYIININNLKQSIELLHSKLSPLRQYYRMLLSKTKEKLEEARSSLSGISISSIAESVREGLPSELENSVLRIDVLLKHEIASVLVWLSDVNNIQLDLLAFNIGLIKIIER